MGTLNTHSKLKLYCKYDGHYPTNLSYSGVSSVRDQNYAYLHQASILCDLTSSNL